MNSLRGDWDRNTETQRTRLQRTRLRASTKAGHVKAGRSDVNFGEFDLPCFDAHSALQNKGCRLLAWNCSDRASKFLGQKNGPRRDMRMTGFIVAEFRFCPIDLSKAFLDSGGKSQNSPRTPEKIPETP